MKKNDGLRQCPRCKRPTVRIKVDLNLDIDPIVYGRLSKKNVATRHVRVEGASWPSMVMYCTRWQCGHFVRFKP